LSVLGRLNHVALAVPDLPAAARRYREALDASVSPPEALPEHGVIVVFVELPNARIELIAPLGESSPIAGFLERNPRGGMHHVCYEVDDLSAACARLRSAGAAILGEPAIGAHGRPVVFVDPRDFYGTLIELEEVPR
jgi:methylmalonyl-CoA/ethylmalonyl-CoA epimerase